MAPQPTDAVKTESIASAVGEASHHDVLTTVTTAHMQDGKLLLANGTTVDWQSGSYQTVRALTEDELAALQEDVRERGVHMHILVDNQGVVIDGHHRCKVFSELAAEGVQLRPLGVIVVDAQDDQEKRDLNRTLNVNRRQLTREERRQYIKDALIAHPDWSDRAIAKGCGADHKTVRDVRRELEATGEIPQLATRVGRDGKMRQVKTRPAPTQEGACGEVLGVPDGIAEQDTAPSEIIPAASDTDELVPQLEGDATTDTEQVSGETDSPGPGLTPAGLADACSTEVEPRDELLSLVSLSEGDVLDEEALLALVRDHVLTVVTLTPNVGGGGRLVLDYAPRA